MFNPSAILRVARSEPMRQLLIVLVAMGIGGLVAAAGYGGVTLKLKINTYQWSFNSFRLGMTAMLLFALVVIAKSAAIAARDQRASEVGGG